ncbi:MAG: hypothetical protein WCD76_02810, partial [Pyrinomonadaceae bacterium]
YQRPPKIMNSKLSISFESPQSGWMSVRLRSGAESFVAVVSHAPADSLVELMRGLTALLSGEKNITVRWNAEPEEFDFIFSVGGERVELKIVRFLDHRRATRTREVVFTFKGSLRDLCLPFWTELRGLRERSETDVFISNWRRAFPEQELRELTRAVETFAGTSPVRADIS